MLRHMKYLDAERRLASVARETAMNRDVLYHGTRYPQLILRTGVLFRAESGGTKVCFTRAAEVAAYWALLERDDDEGRGAILILDRQSLDRRYKLVPNPQAYWHTETLFHDEAEEEIWDDVTDIDKYLIGFVSGPTARGVRRMPRLNHRRRTRLNLKFREKIEARVLNLSPPDNPDHLVMISKLRLDASVRSRRGAVADRLQAKVQR
jgi:hypothetical protein